MLNVKKLLAGASASVLASTALIGGMMAAATPASATAWDCQEYLKQHGYFVNAVKIDACGRGTNGTMGSHIACVTQLVGDRVKSRDAENSCDLAPNGD